jgi:putative SOS response-associated peptidase YedK
MTLAGLWDFWTAPDEETTKFFTIITTTANALLQPLHGRMPVLLTPESWADWLGETAASDARTQNPAQTPSRRRLGLLAGGSAHRQRQKRQSGFVCTARVRTIGRLRGYYLPTTDRSE